MRPDHGEHGGEARLSNIPLRVCYFGTYRDRYPRNEVAVLGLRANAVEVEECHVTLWRGIEDRVKQASGGWRNPGFWWRVALAYWRLALAHTRTADYDVMLVGYPGQFDVYLGRFLSWWRRKPMVLDIFMSLHLIAEERGLIRRSPATGRLIFWLENGGLKLPDALISDTREYVEYYCEKYRLSPDRFALVPTGVDERRFQLRPQLDPRADHFRVLYYGTFIPLHGVDTMIRAAHELREHGSIRFDFYGERPERGPAENLARDLGLGNVRFHGWIERDALPEEIAKSHLCFGVFGTTKQSCCTIQNKIWEAMATGRPVITGDADTIRETLTHLEHVHLVERASPRALARGILELWASPALRDHLAREGYVRAQQNTIAATGALIKGALLAVTAGRS